MASRNLYTCLSPALLDLYDISNSVVVIIDVLRATSTIATALYNGASSVIPVATVPQCIELGEAVGGITYTDAEKEFALNLQKSFIGNVPPIEDAQKVFPMRIDEKSGGGSTDVGDVSYTVPTVGLSTATWVPGTPAHSWQAVSCGTTDIAAKGMINAAKVMAMTAIDLYNQPTTIQKAKEEFNLLKGNYKYQALLGDRPPALNYRDN